MRRSAIRRHIGEEVDIRTPQGDWSGRVEAVPRGFAVIGGHQFPLSTLDASNVNGKMELRTWSAPNTLAALLSYMGQPIRGAYGGMAVTPKSAVEGTIAVYACVSLRADMVAALPMHLFRRVAANRREEIDYADTYPGSLARLLGSAPNPEQTAQEFWETVVGHHDLWGNFYGNLQRDPVSGRPVACWPLNPAQTTAIRDKDTGQKFVRTHVLGGQLDLKPEEYVHIRGPISSDGLNGLAPITVARTAVGIEQGASEHGAQFFLNGSEPGGILSVDGKLQDEDRKMIRERWQEAHGGMTNAHRVAVLGNGVTWQAVGMSHHDSEFLETRKFQVLEIARLYRIPPHMVQDVERSTSWGTGIEYQNVGFHTYTLRPILSRIEAAISRDFGFPVSGRTLNDDNLYAAFDPDHLLRADSLTRAQVNHIKRLDGIINANEWRAQDDEPPIEGPAGTVYLDPANYVQMGPGGVIPLAAPSMNGNGKSPQPEPSVD